MLFYWWFRVDSVDPKIDYADIADIEFVNADTELGIDKKKRRPEQRLLLRHWSLQGHHSVQGKLRQLSI